MARSTLRGATSGAKNTARSGAVLPATLLVLIGIAVLAGAGFLVAFFELRSGENHAASVRAFYAAEAGLNEALATLDPADTAAMRTWTYGGGRGSALVISRRLLHVDALRDLRLISSEGSYRPGREGVVRRTVAQLTLAPRPLRPPAALVSLDTVALAPSGRVSGIDPAGSRCPEEASRTAGLMTFPGGYLGDPASLGGSPPLREEPSLGAALLGSGLDWTNFALPEFLEPDAWVVDAWPTLPFGGDAWSALYAAPNAPAVTGSVAGRGVLVVAGDLIVSGELSWEGIVLVGGAVTASGRLSVRGALLLGLDALGGSPAGRSDLSSVVRVDYDACAVAGAGRRLVRGAVRQPGGWYEIF